MTVQDFSCYFPRYKFLPGVHVLYLYGRFRGIFKMGNSELVRHSVCVNKQCVGKQSRAISVWSSVNSMIQPITTESRPTNNNTTTTSSMTARTAAVTAVIAAAATAAGVTVSWQTGSVLKDLLLETCSA